MSEDQSSLQESDEASDAPRDPVADGPVERGTRSHRVRRYLNYALLAGLVLLAVIAGLRFYFEASTAINQWITSEYRSLFQAAFNLIVLLLAGLGISRQVSRLS